jgi:SAM-dependent methyltransferase
LLRLDGHGLCFKPASFDAIILYEAIYYLRDPELFIRECRRVLRPGGKLLLCTANKDLPDFNPSPHSYRYFSPADFSDLLEGYDFRVECYGDCPINDHDPLHRVLSFIKKTVVRLNLMPKTMRGKRLFKRIVFGKLVDLPAELTANGWDGTLPQPIDPHKPDRKNKVIFAIGTKM